MEYYGATASIGQAHHCLTPDEILNHFGQRKAVAQGKYRNFIQDGIGIRSIWEKIEAQSLLSTGRIGSCITTIEFRRRNTNSGVGAVIVRRCYTMTTCLVKVLPAPGRPRAMAVLLQATQ